MLEPNRAQASGSVSVKKILGLMVATAVVTMLVAIGLAALLINIHERQAEARNPFFRVVELDDETTDPAIWGQNFPLQYDAYLRTVDQERTRYGGSEAIHRTPTDVDPRSVLARSKLEEDPRLVKIFSGYPFATDYREARGHAYMLDDQTYTGRQAFPMPGTCANCHASVYVPMKRLGDGDLLKGFDIFNAMPFQEARAEVEHPVACIDCHDPDTMALRITRPAFMAGIREYKKVSEGIEDYDVNTMATRQEMRAFVCGQCHVEYYFQGPERRLVFPWHKGVGADDMLEYYEEIAFSDWTHAMTGAPSLKVQHPEFELWNKGIHGRSGVTCADCHMPYQRVGAFKISDHQVRSPLLNISKSCQTCHRDDEETLLAKAHNIQNKTYETRNIAMDALVELIADIQATSATVTAAQLDTARNFQRRSQFMVDFVEAENSMGFHGSQEAMRVLALSLEYARKGQRALSGFPDRILPADAKTIADIVAAAQTEAATDEGAEADAMSADDATAGMEATSGDEAPDSDY